MACPPGCVAFLEHVVGNVFHILRARFALQSGECSARTGVLSNHSWTNSCLSWCSLHDAVGFLEVKLLEEQRYPFGACHMGSIHLTFGFHDPCWWQIIILVYCILQNLSFFRQMWSFLNAWGNRIPVPQWQYSVWRMWATISQFGHTGPEQCPTLLTLGGRTPNLGTHHLWKLSPYSSRNDQNHFLYISQPWWPKVSL